MTIEERAEEVRFEYAELVHLPDVVDEERTRDNIAAAIREAVAEERERWRRSLCPHCSPAHVLDNGRVWEMCGCQRAMMGGMSEEHAAAAIREGVSAKPAPAWTKTPPAEQGLYWWREVAGGVRRLMRVWYSDGPDCGMPAGVYCREYRPLAPSVPLAGAEGEWWPVPLEEPT